MVFPLPMILLISILFVHSLEAIRVRLSSQTFARSHSMTPQVVSTLKLPVWPIYGGVIAQLADWASLPAVTEGILNTVGGRVVPMTLGDMNCSPFLLLAHHAHSFMPMDPIRSLTRLLLPEGFPAHPHSGFSTVTYCIDGGLRHRDSEGNKMAYGNGDVQWMTAGRGTIHEEMWDCSEDSKDFKKIEIFQLWVNLPRSGKDSIPRVNVLRNSAIPVYISADSSVRAKVIAGSLETDRDDQVIIGPGNDESSSPVAIFHLALSSDAVADLLIPRGSTVAVYIRRGSLMIPTPEEDSQTSRAAPTGNGEMQHDTRMKEVSLCSLLHYNDVDSKPMTISGSDAAADNDEAGREGSWSVLSLRAGKRAADCLLLVGKPLDEPALMRGPLVQASEEDMMRSARVFNAVGQGAYWDYTLSDTKWREHCEKLNLQGVIEAVTALGAGVSACDFHPSGRYVATGSNDYTWRLWDVETGTELMDGHSKGSSTLSFHIDGSLILTADFAGIWDIPSGQQIQAFQGHANKITSSCFSPNGFLAATGGTDNMVRIWDLRKRKCSYVIPAHTDVISDVRYSMSGEVLVTSSFDATVKLWGARDHRLLQSLSRNVGNVMASDISPKDGKHVISAGYDRTFKLWSHRDEY